MKTVFCAAMRHATKLTRAQNLVEATQAIQRALSGRSEASPPAEPAQKKPGLLGSQPSADARVNTLEFSHAEAPAPRAGPRDESPPFGPIARFRKPLGEVLKLLKEAELPGVRLDPALLLKPGKEPKTPEGAAFLSRKFTCEAGAREYKVYVPSGARGRKLPLLIMLHGCAQDANDFALGTGMNHLSEEHGFIVAYPRQAVRANHSRCWNWFSMADQRRDAGEPSIIAGITRAIMEEFRVDSRRVYIAGLSAGGAMAAVMCATYPELYEAAGIHSGLAYGSATDVASAFAAMKGAANLASDRGGARRAGARTIVFHGASDRTVHPSNGEVIFSAASVGLPNGEVVQHEGSTGGRAYTRAVVLDPAGVAHAEHWAIDGLGHAWSGGNPEGSYTDRRGPDASREMLRFFLSRSA
jgi:poly(hydroxyalkanoate) depolymerase family esterase